MSTTSNLIKSSYFKVEYGGKEIPTVTDVDLPTMEYEPIKHSSGQNVPDSESQGIPRYGDLIVKRDMVEGQDTTLYKAFETAQTTPDTGSIKKDVIVYVKNVKDKTIWKLKMSGCWVKSYDPPDLVSTHSDTLTETFTISIDEMKQEA